MSKRLKQNLKKRAISWAGQMTKLAKAYAPAHVRPAISSRVENKGDNTFIIRTIADRQKAPDARAQEFGSGLHARRGAKKKYPIRPREKKVLAFDWEVANAEPERFIFAPDGRVIFGEVQHPGIQAANSGKGYIAPARNELRKKARAELNQDIREAVMGDLRESFGKKLR